MTYGQLKDGKRYTYAEFKKEVSGMLKAATGTELKGKLSKECKKLYDRGQSVDDAVSYLILKT